MITSQRTPILESMTETIKIPLESYEDLLFVKERLSMYYSVMERSLRLSYGQHDIECCQLFMAHQLSVIGSKQKTPFHKALYMTLIEVKHKADCGQPLATIHVMNRIAQLYGYGPLRSTTEVQGDRNPFPREVECARPTTSLSRKAAKEQAVRVARAGSTLLKNYHTTKEIKIIMIGISTVIITDLWHSMPPIVYISRRLISGKMVTHPLEGTSTPL
jgi:hypothetical protein